MKKLVFIILILGIAALFAVPESALGEYKGLLRLKYFLKDTAYKIKDIVSEFAREGESEKLKDFGNELKESVEKKIEQDTSTTTKKAFEINIGVGE